MQYKNLSKHFKRLRLPPTSLNREEHVGKQTTIFLMQNLTIFSIFGQGHSFYFATLKTNLYLTCNCSEKSVHHPVDYLLEVPPLHCLNIQLYSFTLIHS